MNTGEVRNIDELKGWDKNPRSITKKDFDRLKAQIAKLGVYKPILINQDNIVLGGNMRFAALQEIGQKQVWVSVVKTETEAQMIEYALSDNDRAGSYEEAQLAELVTLFPIEQELFKVDLGKLTPIKEVIDKYGPTPEEDEPPAVDEQGEPQSVLGEIYDLGRHKLLCGDATDEDAVRALVGGGAIDMVFTDPPYNVDYTGKTKDSLKIQNDKMDDTQFYDLLYLGFSNMLKVAKKGAVIYVCHADSEGLAFRQAFKDAGWTLKQCIIWVKNVMVMGRQDYHWKHEPILYGWVEGAKHYFLNDRKQTTVWDVDRPTVSKDHPTMKPIALIDRALRNSTKEGDIVLDLFGGSGSTLMACEKAGRTCLTMELDPRYCDVIRKRYKLYTEAEE